MKTYGQFTNENYIRWQDGEELPDAYISSTQHMSPKGDGNIEHLEDSNEYLFEKHLNDDEIEDLINKAGRAATNVSNDKKKTKEERAKAKDVFDFVTSVRSTWRKEKSLHPSAVNALMRIVVGVSSSNNRGYGYKTTGFSGSPSGAVPQQYGEEEMKPLGIRRILETPEGTEEEIDEARRSGMTEALIKSTALLTKRWIINKGAEGNVSAQINGLAGLVLLDMALSDRGSSIISKALAVSGLYKG